MKIAITVTKMQQISYDEFKDFYFTKIFDDTTTIKDINEWVSTINKDIKDGILVAKLSEVIE